MTFSLHGLSIGSGLGGAADVIAIGRAVRNLSGRVSVAHYFIAPAQAQLEVERVREARNAVVDNMRRLQLGLSIGDHKDVPHELSAIMDVHLMLLQDKTLAEGVRHFIKEQHYNAEWAVTAQLEVIAAQFDNMHDPYMRERKSDLEQVAERLLAQLRGTAQPVSSCLDAQSSVESVILVAHDLSPAETVRFKGDMVSGFVTDVGGITSHTAIVARSMSIPAVVGVKNASQLVRQDDLVILDADAGVLIVNPTQEILAQYQQKKAEQLQRRRKSQTSQSSAATASAPLLAADGSVITLLANIERPGDTFAALEAGAQGIGLFRTEFLFMGRTQLPDEDEQYQAYSEVVLAMRGMPVTIRTIDIGADKPLEASHTGESKAYTNPVLGLRAIRWCLAEPAMFLTQLRALLRAASHGRIHILIPMLTNEHEIKQSLSMIGRAKAQLRKLGVDYGEVEIGAMIEVPAAALMIPTFIRHFDFLSIGSNDLIQYTLAADRTDASVAHLYDPAHPAVQFLIESTIKQCLAVRKPISICGEMAGDELHIKPLLDMGLRSFSMSTPQIRAFKNIVSRQNFSYTARLPSQ